MESFDADIKVLQYCWTISWAIYATPPEQSTLTVVGNECIYCDRYRGEEDLKFAKQHANST